MSGIALLNEQACGFPDVENALPEPNGLLAVGGDLSEPRLISAYQQGIFPWYDADQPILWWSPDPRCVLRPNEFYCSKSLAKKIRRGQYRVTFDFAFERVIEACASTRKDQLGTWITSEMAQAYSALHHRQLAHSVEVWHEEQLIGGLYGMAMGSVFFGESMFSRERDASKIALFHLCRFLQERAFSIIDCQVYNPHLESMGAKCIPRSEFCAHLKLAIHDPYESYWN